MCTLHIISGRLYMSATLHRALLLCCALDLGCDFDARGLPEGADEAETDASPWSDPPDLQPDPLADGGSGEADDAAGAGVGDADAAMCSPCDAAPEPPDDDEGEEGHGHGNGGGPG